MGGIEQDRAFIKAVIPEAMLTEALEWISANMPPEAVFTPDQLAEWAEANGYTREQE